MQRYKHFFNSRPTAVVFYGMMAGWHDGVQLAIPN
jgi:hypothetical protein